jgi:CyaY protein
MMNEHEFREKASEALEDLENRLSAIAEEFEFDIESGGGMLTLIFEDPAPAKFILSPNTPARQIWVSALSTSYKFDWNDASRTFTLDRSGEPLVTVIRQLLNTQLGKTIDL